MNHVFVCLSVVRLQHLPCCTDAYPDVLLASPGPDGLTPIPSPTDPHPFN